MTVVLCLSFFSIETLIMVEVGKSGTPAHDAAYYAKCSVGGILACGLTHAAVTPLGQYFLTSVIFVDRFR